MTEIERMLRDTLARMEQDLSAKLDSQGKTLEEQRQTLQALQAALASQQERINRMSDDLQALMRRLHDVSDVYKSLEPLLPTLHGILSGSGR
jgi:uncharacterized coiled-coil protein SlyX